MEGLHIEQKLEKNIERQICLNGLPMESQQTYGLLSALRRTSSWPELSEVSARIKLCTCLKTISVLLPRSRFEPDPTTHHKMGNFDCVPLLVSY